MAQDKRAVPHNIIDVNVAVQIPFLGAARASDIGEERQERAEVVGHPAGQHAAGPFVRQLGVGICVDVSGDELGIDCAAIGHLPSPMEAFCRAAKYLAFTERKTLLALRSMTARRQGWDRVTSQSLRRATTPSRRK